MPFDAQYLYIIWVFYFAALYLLFNPLQKVRRGRKRLDADKAGKHVPRYCVLCWKKESANLARHLKTHCKTDKERNKVLTQCSEHTPSGVRTCSFDDMPKSLKDLWLSSNTRTEVVDFFKKKLGCEILMDSDRTVSRYLVITDTYFDPQFQQ